jgi:hypothetical protein
MDTSFTSLMATLDRKAASIVVTGEESRFRHRKRTFEAGCSTAQRSRWRELALTIQQGGQNQQDQHHHKQQDRMR